MKPSDVRMAIKLLEKAERHHEIAVRSLTRSFWYSGGTETQRRERERYGANEEKMVEALVTLRDLLLAELSPEAEGRSK